MKTAKGWRQMQKEGFPVHNGSVTLEELRSYLEGLFNVEPPRFTIGYPVYYPREDGTEMVTFRGGSVMGGAMPLVEWNKLMESQASTFLSPDKFVKSETSTKITLDHNIEVTITYDGNFIDETKYITKNKVK